MKKDESLKRNNNNFKQMEKYSFLDFILVFSSVSTWGQVASNN